LEKEKLEQLRKVFKKILSKYFEYYYEWTFDDATAELLYEVKIRIK